MGILTSLFAGVSGLNANGTALSVIGNNIANIGTVGFKGSRATFADMINSSISGGSGAIQTGIGVALTSVQGDFTQGSFSTTNNTLDMAIDGNGFFVLTDSQNATYYGRSGIFHLDENNVVVDPSGFKLQGYQTNAAGVVTGNIGDIALPTTISIPNPTTTADISANVSASTAITGTRPGVVGSAAVSTTTAAGNNSFTINLHGDGAQTVTVANGLTGSSLASAIQSAVRALSATNPYLQAAYDGFEVTVSTTGVFTLRSGMSGTTNDSTSNTTTMTLAANGADTLYTNLNVSAGTTTTGSDFDITDPVGSSNYQVPLTVYDSLGNARLMTTYWTKVGANTWNYNIVANSADIDTANYHSGNIDTTLGVVRVGAGTLTFDTDGTLQRESTVIRFDTGTLAGTSGSTAGQAQIDFLGATADQLITFDYGPSVVTDSGTGLGGVTQFGAQNAIVSLSQDGYGAGTMQSFAVDVNGIISGRFSNGQLRTLAQVVLARFPDPIGLARVGKNVYAESATSGQPLLGAPDSAGLGRVMSKSLELSNVDLGQSFIDMIAAQRGFQASSRVITTSDEMLQELVNLKR